MRILKIFDGEYPWDIRVEKICDSLIAAGHEVRLLCRNRDRRIRAELHPSGLGIRRLPEWSGPVSVPFFFNPLWVQSARSEVESYRPDLILVRDLPLAPLGVFLANRSGIPAIADLAEPYPESLRSQLQFHPLSFGGRLVRNARLAEAVERWVCRRIDHVFVVCPEAAARLERQGLPANRWTEVGNTPRLERFKVRGAPTPELDGLDERVVIFFSGLLAGDRGLDLAVEAIAELEARRPGRYSLVIVGDGPVAAGVRARAEELGVSEAVRLTGFVEHARLPDLISRADIGLLPFRACAHIESTLANKLFEYMSLEIPIVASDAAPMARVLGDTGAGRLFRSDDAASLAATIEEVTADAEALKRYGKGGGRAVRGRYNWAVDADRMLEALERVGRSHP